MSKSNWFRLSSFQIFDLMFNQRNIHELTCRFAVVLLLTCQCLADDGYEMDDFLKREYSLTKPYQGRLSKRFAGVGFTISNYYFSFQTMFTNIYICSVQKHNWCIQQISIELLSVRYGYWQDSVISSSEQYRVSKSRSWEPQGVHVLFIAMLIQIISSSLSFYYLNQLCSVMAKTTSDTTSCNCIWLHIDSQNRSW